MTAPHSSPTSWEGHEIHVMAQFQMLKPPMLLPLGLELVDAVLLLYSRNPQQEKGSHYGQVHHKISTLKCQDKGEETVE